jgi:methoxymalonate biosynthesis acyl carrier protein
MTTGQVQSRLQRFVNDALGSEVPPDANIFESGATSLFAMELVMFIEESFGVELADDDLEAENFTSIAAMTSLAQRKLADR